MFMLNSDPALEDDYIKSNGAKGKPSEDGGWKNYIDLESRGKLNMYLNWTIIHNDITFIA